MLLVGHQVDKLLQWTLGVCSEPRGIWPEVSMEHKPVKLKSRERAKKERSVFDVWL